MKRPTLNELRWFIRFLGSHIIEGIEKDSARESKALPPRSFTEFMGSLHDDDPCKSVLKSAVEALAIQFGQYGAEIANEEALAVMGGIYQLVRTEWLYDRWVV
jgi:hypothetical protein